MPRGPLIESPRLRTIIVAGVMWLLLVVCLLGAYGLTRASAGVRRAVLRPMQVGDLNLAVPQDWTVSPEPETRAGAPGLEPLAHLTDPDQRSRSLSVHLMEDGPALTPISALHLALRRLFGENAYNMEPLEKSVLRRGRSVAAVYAGVLSDPAAGSQAHIVAAVTHDGRRHWVLHLTQPMRESDVFRPLGDATRLLSRMLETVAFADHRPAEASDFAGADLPVTTVPGFEAYVAPQRTQAQPVTLVPQGEQAALATLQLRGTIEGGDESALSPAKLLASQHFKITGRGATADSLYRETLAGLTVWRLTLSAGNEQWPHREICLFRLAQGRAVLADVITDASLKPRLRPWLEQIARALVKGGGEDPSNTQAFDIDAALLRGSALAAALRSAAATQSPDARHYLLERQGKVTGGAVEQILPRAPGNLPLRGRLLIRSISPADRKLTQIWAADDKLQSFVQATRIEAAHDSPDGAEVSGADPGADPSAPAPQVRRRASPTATEQQLLQLRSRMLEYRQLTGDPGKLTASWRAGEPSAYLPPMADQAWPAAVLQDEKLFPAILWTQDALFPPEPVLMVREASAARMEADAPAAGAVTLRIRPIMSMCDQRVVRDAQGHIRWMQWVEESYSPTGGVQRVARAVPLAELLTRLPAMQLDLETWNHEVQDHAPPATFPSNPEPAPPTGSDLPS